MENKVELPEGCVIVKKEQLDTLINKVRSQDIALTNAFTLIKIVQPVMTSFMPKTEVENPQGIDFFKIIGGLKKLIEGENKNLFVQCIKTLMEFKEGYEKEHPVIHQNAKPE